MTNQKISLGSVEWLDYVQQTDKRLLNKFGERERIISGWGSSEFQIGPYFVDGYCEVDENKFVFEYNGCHFHTCSRCKSVGLSSNDSKKLDYLKSMNLQVIEMAECQWQKSRKNLIYKSGISRLILKKSISEAKLIKHFSENNLYGFALVDIESNSKAQKFLDMNWPPLFFQRGKLILMICQIG